MEAKKKLISRNKTNARKWKHQEGGSLYSAGNMVDAIYANNPKSIYLGMPEHKYDFTQSEEWANAHGYFPDERGHRDDRVKKESHPTHPSRGSWKGINQFHLTDKGMENVNHILFGMVDGGQDPQATLYYKNSIVLPEITVTPKENYYHNTYDNVKLVSKKKLQTGGSVPKFQKPAGGIALVGKDRSPGITGWFKEWWNDYPTDYSDGMCATDSKGNLIGDCAKYSNNVLKSQGYNAVGDAWLRIPYSGAKTLYSGYDNNLPKTYDEKTYWDYMNAAADRLADSIDINQLQDYDIVGLTTAGSPSTEKAYNAGKKHGRINTHTGHIRVGKDGTRYVIHNVHNNLYQHKAEDLLGGNKTFSIVEIARPKKKKK